jgi:hypothetical protein
MAKVINEKLPYSKAVETHIKKCIAGGVPIKDILLSMQGLQHAPGAVSTLYKLYGDVIHSARVDLNAKVGKKVIDQALEGDFKSQELFLRSKAGWSPKETVETAEATDDDLGSSALDELMGMLGIQGGVISPEDSVGLPEDQENEETK